MEKFRAAAYLRVLLFLVLGIILVIYYLEEQAGPAKLTQTTTVGSKTVHFVSDRPVSYSTSNEGDSIIVNGKPLDLAGGNEFTVIVATDGAATLRPGKP